MSQDREDLNSSDGGSNRLAWFITGAIIGVTVAMLYAPKSGKDSRQYISDQTDKGKETVSDSAKEVAETSREMFERGRKVVEDAANLFDRARKLVRG
ncbi:MAG TPA: YtxH domain-containing protein [Bryobacteraceae bacterium]|jgi:gas vesicle protein|nr:YtxH domain-containing protein [Bryobacteraceae bacterium]